MKTSADYYTILVQVYASLFCVLLLLIQIQLPFVVRNVAILDQWTFRGLFFVYIGLITRDDTWHPLLIHDLIGMILAGVGLAYFLMVLFCRHRIYKAHYLY